MTNSTFTSLATVPISNSTDFVQTSGYSEIGKGPGLYVSDPTKTAAFVQAHPRFAVLAADGRVFRAQSVNGAIDPALGGANGDNTTDDRPAIKAAHDYALATGTAAVSFSKRTYRLNPVPTSELNYNLGPQPCYVVPPSGTAIDGGGASFNLASGGRGMVSGFSYSGGFTDLALAADVVAGSTTVQLVQGAGAALSVGDDVLWKLGDVPFDPTETYNWGLAKVIAINGDAVTIDRPVPESFSLAEPSANNRHLRKLSVVRDLRLRDLTITTQNSGETGVTIFGGERITIERLGGSGLAAATVLMQYVDGATLTDCWRSGVNLLLPSSGAAFAFAECRNISMIRPRASQTKTLVRAEAGAEVSVSGARFENNLLDPQGQPYGTQIQIFQSSGRARLSARDTTVTGYGGYNLAVVSNGNAGHDGDVHFSGRTRLIHPTEPYSLPISRMSGTLDLTIADKREVYNLDKLRLYRRRFSLRDSNYLTVLGPVGILVRAKVYVSPGVTIGTGQQLTSFSIGRQGDNGGNLATGAMGGIRAGIDAPIQVKGGVVAGIQWLQRSLPLQFNCSTSAVGGLDNASEFVEIEAWIAEPEGMDQTVSEANWRAMNADREVLEARFASYDLPAIAAGATLTVDFTVPDMVAGDMIAGVSLKSGLSGLTITSAEGLAGKARVTFANQSAAAIDKAATDIVIAFSHVALGT